MGMTVAQKILARASWRESVAVGELVEPSVDLALSHENAALVINQFLEIFKDSGLEPRVWDPQKLAIVFDHRVPAESAKTATHQRRVREFVAAHGIRRFHDIRGDTGGICHQVLPECGYVRPGMLVVGTDSHTSSHGALGALAFGVGATEMASIWALGVASSVEVPPSIRVEVNGRFPNLVGAKDLMLALIGRLGAEGAAFRVLEFSGEVIRTMPTSGRLVLCNMSVEAGATSGVVPADSETLGYLRGDAAVVEPLAAVIPDADARYERTVVFDVSRLAPQVACPHAVDNVKPVDEVEGVKVQQVMIGSCTNGRLDDIEAAVRVLRGRKVCRGTRLLVFPASARVYRDALDLGYVAELMQAGAVVMNAGCGPCLGVHEGALGDGEVALATTNRNFRGRMGNPAAEVYLCSPEVAAASAVRGVISDPRKVA